MANEIQQLKQRTITILDTFRNLYPKSDIFRGVDIDFITNIDEDVKNGFHELHLKCLIFKKLAANLSEETFMALPEKAQILVELLFNPSLEDDLRDSLGKMNLDRLLKKFKALKIEDLSYDRFWESDYNREFDNLKKSINIYLEWYRLRRYSLYTNEENVISPDYDNILEKMAFSAEDVEQEDFQHLALAKNMRLGTTGLNNCIAEIGVQKTASIPEVDVTHISSGFEESLQDLNNRFDSTKGSVGCYLVGGLPIFFYDFLPLIYENKYNIYDVRLARSISSRSSCAAVSDGTHASVHYSGNLAHQPKALDPYYPEFRPNIINIPAAMYHHNPIRPRASNKRKLTAEIADATDENEVKFSRNSSSQ